MKINRKLSRGYVQKSAGIEIALRNVPNILHINCLRVQKVKLAKDLYLIGKLKSGAGAQNIYIYTYIYIGTNLPLDMTGKPLKKILLQILSSK